MYEGIVYKDIITRYNIKQEVVLKELIFYLASNLGKEFSYSKLASLMGLSSPHTLRNYCHYLEQSYLCFFIPRYSPSLKKQIQYNKKCYLIDPTIARNIGFRPTEDKGGFLENIVFLELKRQGKDLYFHKDKQKCDFIIKEGYRITQAIQVTQHLEDDKLRKREIEGLLEAMRAYELEEGLILTQDHEESLTIEKYQINIKSIWKWLLENSLMIKNIKA